MKVCSKLLRGEERGWRGGGEGGGEGVERGEERGWRGGGEGGGEGVMSLNKSFLYKSSTCNCLLEFTM